MKLHHFATKAWGNTADAARYVAEQGDQTLAAIASAETAKLYGLQILAEGVNEDGDNTTRFIVIEKEGTQRAADRRRTGAAAFDAVYGGPQAGAAGAGDPDHRRARL